jgi:serine phosphatase RsbU (regulator of sigma subunit)
VSIHQSLLGNLALVIALLGAATLALTFVGSQQTAKRLSGVILDKTVSQVALNLRQFFEPVTRNLALLRAWESSGLLDSDDAAAMNRLLTPLLRADPQLSAIMVADERGREHILFHVGDGWRSRHTRRDMWESRAAWLEWSDDRPEPTASWQESDYDPRERPWYRGALAARAAAAGSAPGDSVHWTEPYTFYTLRVPGMTAAMAFTGRDGRLRVVGVDLLLTEISAFTTGLRAGAHGKVLVLTDDGRVIGLPHDPRYQTVEAQLDAVLKRPDELESPVVAAVTRALATRPAERPDPLRLTADGTAWWADVSAFPLGPGRRLAIEVMAPESDLLEGLGHLRVGIVLVTLAALGLALVHSVRLARRYSRPIEALVRESERISRGDLDGGPAVQTPIREVHRLADAHERMRGSLRTLLKLEGDLQVARRIQQDTLPERIPVVAGFDIAAWNEPAEATGGDTFDVIGFRRVPGAGGHRLSSTETDGAVLLLADASGHGIGPALSVTQVRAMLRMAVRLGEDLPAILRHLNAQLCADLTDGRFVSAWLGELDVEAQTLTAVSCGQGPLLYYRAGADVCEVLATDTLPLGCLDDLECALRPPIRMQPGDVFVALSDGVVDAENEAGERFGTKAVASLIADGRDRSAGELTGRLREALAAFTGGAPADDDRTALIIKRG